MEVEVCEFKELLWKVPPHRLSLTLHLFNYNYEYVTKEVYGYYIKEFIWKVLSPQIELNTSLVQLELFICYSENLG